MSLGITYVFDQQNSVTGEHSSIYRCEECGALVESENTDLHLDWHRKSDPVAAERARFLLIAGQCDRLGADAARDPGMYSGPADGFVWAAEAIRNAVAEAEE